MEELTMKIEDVEALVDEVADIAYDKAVEVVADTAVSYTHLKSRTEWKLDRYYRRYVHRDFREQHHFCLLYTSIRRESILHL